MCLYITNFYSIDNNLYIIYKNPLFQKKLVLIKIKDSNINKMINKRKKLQC